MKLFTNRRMRGYSSFGIVVGLAVIGMTWFIASHAKSDPPDESTFAAEATTEPFVWAPISGKHYFVSNIGNDANDGSAKKPWATLQHAADIATAGATVHVLPGIYQGSIVTRNSGQGDAPIRFLSEEQWRARIVGVGRDFAWRNDGSYVDIAGFDVRGNGSYGILNMGSNVRIVGNHVHDIPARGCTDEGGAGIDNGNYSGHDDDVISNVVERIGTAGARCNRVHGIYHSNLRGRIWNNVSCDNQGWGIHLWHAAQATVIANNLVCRNGEGGIVVGTSGAEPANHMLVANNILLENGRPGGGYAIDEFGYVGRNNHYVNNLIFGGEQKIVLKNGNRDAGTIRKDPMLVGYRRGDSADYHLADGSPAIGTATSSGAPPFDLEGSARPVAGRWDVGPYQYQSQGKPWPWY